MKICYKCKIIKNNNEFFKNHTVKGGLNSYCKQCSHKIKALDVYRMKASNLKSSITTRAKNRGIYVDVEYFTLDRIEDMIKEAKYCQCCGRKFEVRYGDKDDCQARDNSISLDRFYSSLGYTKDNVNIICWRCNKVKTNASIEELEAVVIWMKQKVGNKTFY